MVDFGTNDIMPHFIYCNFDSEIACRMVMPWPTVQEWREFTDKELRGIIMKKMREFGIQSSILTTIKMTRKHLITKEKEEEAAEGKLKNDPEWRLYKGSINEDLDSFMNNLPNSNEMRDEDVWSFFLPKLTKKELKLVEENNEEHLGKYLWTYYSTSRNADVDVKEMKQSDSKDKYVAFECHRKTVYLTQESNHVNHVNVL